MVRHLSSRGSRRGNRKASRMASRKVLHMDSLVNRKVLSMAPTMVNRKVRRSRSPYMVSRSNLMGNRMPVSLRGNRMRPTRRSAISLI